jgi:cell division protein FtsZ
LSLFERVTNASRLMKRDEPQAPRVTPAAPSQPRLGQLDPSERLAPSNREEDILDIPAFLRRQAN